MSPGSLRLRLAAGGAAAIATALVLAGIALTYLFERQALASLANALEFDLRQVLAAVELDANGKPVLRREPADPRFKEPLSGLYWQIATAAGGQTRSRSLWDTALPLPDDDLSSGGIHRHRIAGPGGSELLAVERSVMLKAKDAPVPVRLAVAADLGKIAEARRSFASDLIPSLGLLALVLAAATWIQIGLGLRPLGRIQEGVAKIRQGQSRRLEGPTPREVEPLIDEINGLLVAQEQALERARGRAADLAHGLKTPLAALAADIKDLEDRGQHDIARRVSEVGESMRRHVERQLARARIRGSIGTAAGLGTALRPLLQSLVSIQRRAGQDTAVAFDLAFSGEPMIAMDKTDLAEVLGNILENAARHAASKVRISVTGDGRVAVEDDGPGLAGDQLDAVLQRGVRLDETAGGSGLGLAIAQDILEAYDRRLSLERSGLGGLKAIF